MLYSHLITKRRSAQTFHVNGSKPFTLENRSGSNIWKAPKPQIWLVKFEFVRLLSWNLSDFLAEPFIFRYWKPKSFNMEVRIRAVMKNEIFFSSNTFNNKSPSFIFIKIVQKQTSYLEYGVCKPVWHFSMFTHTAQWHSYYSRLLISFYHKVQFLSSVLFPPTLFKEKKVRM